MILDKVLILKGLAGVTALGSAVTVGVVGSKNGWWGSHQLTPEEIKTGLGLPADDNNCVLPTNDNETKTCSNIDVAKLKNINFEGKGSGEPTIENSGSSVTLKITKTNDNTTYPNGGYKFVFETNKDITIPKTSTSDSIFIKKNTNTEFKIKKVDKKLTLEKAWTAKSLGEKVGLLCENSNNKKECSLPTSKNINVAFSSDDKKENAVIQDDAATKKLTYEENVADHNQGFKFTTSSDISLSEPNGKKIEASTNSGTPTYEIKEIEGKWYLAKKTTAQGNSQ